MAEPIVVERADRIAIVTVNRPDRMNALDRAALDELDRTFARLAADPEIGGAILTGAGDRAFIAGADIGELAGLDPVAARGHALRGQAVCAAIEELGKPVVAAVNGFALGGGCEIAMACTLRIASERARFGQPEVKLGVIPGFGGTQRLARLVGRGKAMELILSGEMIDAAEAHRLGLVNRVVPPEQLLDASRDLLGKILANGPLAVRHAIEAVHHGLEMPLEEALFLEANLFGVTFGTEDMKEGTRAFLEKRAPRFRGR
jgi:enoyl-CoA hydratase